ncbi:hypothetical protein DOM22_13600 [Bdellovibrio sp. ZAP7]|uniref:hypothetical protein n=1 Tax=Bdellovibrio sp. ZAP7 TaxID=2231053 RepID=UPI00115A37FD|nr:hypothetical protein [Bdellovibrio sp. ZAP7]QDK46121.1 hypothetical protein DOM22_13600 [Bdellovibrio sp. ZAP7]
MRGMILSSLLMLSAHVSYAIEDVNHVSCMYLKTEGKVNAWNYHYMNQFSLKPGEARIVNSYWSSIKDQGLNRAFCSMMAGTQEPDALEIDFIAYRGEDFSGFEYDDNTCVPWGSHLELEVKKTYRVARGEFVELKLPWLPHDQGTIILREYFPRKDELADLKDLSDKICERIAPEEMRQ